MIVDFIAVNSVPINTLISREFKEMLKRLNQFYKLPSRARFTSCLLPDRAKEVSKFSMDKLKAASNHTLTVEFDGWSAINGSNFIAVTITTHLVSATLLDSIETTSDSVTAEFMTERIFNTLKNTGIQPKQLNAIITDEH